MGGTDILLIVLSTLSSFASVYAAELVHRRLKKARRKKSPVVLSAETLKELVNASGSMQTDSGDQVIQVKGTRKLSASKKNRHRRVRKETEIA